MSQQNNLANKHVRYWALVPAAGIGKRMGSVIPKQYLKLHGKEVLVWALESLQSITSIKQIILVLHPKDEYFYANLAADFPDVLCVEGGDERLDSVASGLEKLRGLAGDEDWVLVHDAVRPCVTQDDINKLINTLEKEAVGGILASAVKDTLKHANPEGQVVETLKREEYWLAATPQMFRYQKLCQAVSAARDNKFPATDEAAAIEAMNWPVQIVPGRGDNIKITSSDDMVLAEYLLQRLDRLNGDIPYA